MISLLKKALAGSSWAARSSRVARKPSKRLQDLSRRPQPDLAGAVYHAMGGMLECRARDVTGDPRATVGEVLKRNPGLLPKPLDQPGGMGRSQPYVCHLDDREQAICIYGDLNVCDRDLFCQHRVTLPNDRCFRVAFG
jgi:hypothetical protein